MFGRLRSRGASLVPCMTAGVERQQTSYNKRFSFAFIMIHEACILLYVFPLTTSVGGDKGRSNDIIVYRGRAASLSYLCQGDSPKSLDLFKC